MLVILFRSKLTDRAGRDYADAAATLAQHAATFEGFVRGALVRCRGVRCIEQTGGIVTDAEAIQAAIHDFITAYNEGDLAGVMTVDDDGLIKLRHGAPAENRDETERRVADVMRAFVGRLTVVNDEIVVSGDLAVVRGTLNITLTPRAGGERQAVARRFLEVWHKADGRWVVFRTMDNVASIDAAR